MEQKGNVQDLVMVVSPHPDDAEINAAGTVAKWTGEGKKVIYVITTNGDKGSSDPEITPHEIAYIREKEQLEASCVLGVQETIFMGYPDQCLEDNSEFRKKLVRLLRTFKPEKVLTVDPHRRYPWHRDHRITGQVVLDAIYPFARDRLSYPEMLEEGLDPHKVEEVLLWGPEDPNCCVDITSTFDLKLEALMCHQSQIQGEKLKRMKTWLRNRAKKEAESENFELGESFHHIDIWW